MKNIYLSLILLYSVLSPFSLANAACSNVTCEELGYSKSDVAGCKSYIYCPLDASYKACYSYKSYTNGACPTGANCDMRYKKIKTPTCIAGYYNNNGTCTACPVGTYQDQTGQTSCKTCATATTTGATSCTTTCDSSYNLASCPSHGTCTSCGGKFALASCDGCSTKNGSKCDYQSVMNKASMCQAIGYGSQTYAFCQSNFTGDGFTFCISVLQEFRTIKKDSGEENVSIICDIMCPTIDSCSTTPCP